MRFLYLAALAGALQTWSNASDLRAQSPTTSPDVYEKIAKVVKPTEAEQKDGIVATVVVKGSEVVIRITKETRVRIQKGKLEEDGTADDFKEGERVSVWYAGDPTKTDPPQVKAKHVILFRPGKPALPPLERGASTNTSSAARGNASAIKNAVAPVTRHRGA